MKLSDLPTRFNIPFANSAGGGYVRTVPQDSQVGIQNGAASLTTGFPPLNFLPVGAGGVPPFGQDMNGILKQITLWNRWQAAGGLATYSSDFSTAVGGYPKNAVLMAASEAHLWLNLVDDNTTNPDSGGANWLPLGLAATQNEVNAGTRNDVFVTPQTLAGYGPSLASLLTTMPIYFNIDAGDGTLGVTSPSTGVVRVPAGKTFVQRGVLSVTTSQTDLNTSANLTYHLRWTRAGGFVLKNLADPAYNPTAAAETSAIFDTTVDDMLVARVVTSAGNVSTIVNLVNKAALFASYSKTTFEQQGGGTWVGLPELTGTVNWARTPKQISVPLASVDTTVNNKSLVEQSAVATRYSLTAHAWGYILLAGYATPYVSGAITVNLEA
jgi:hypothetical protein